MLHFILDVGSVVYNWNL